MKLSNRELDDWKWHITIYLVKLSWTHYQVLMHIEDRGERDFYENEAIRSDWNVNILKGRFHFSLYERLALSRDKNDMMWFLWIWHSWKMLTFMEKSINYIYQIISCFK